MGSQVCLSFCVGKRKSPNKQFPFKPVAWRTQHSAHGPLMLMPAWSVATRGLGPLGAGWAARQDQLPLYRTGGHTDRYRGEGVSGFRRQTGSSSHTIRLRSPLQFSSLPLPDTLPRSSL